MRHFDDILAIAQDRHGGDISDRLAPPKSAPDLTAIADDWWLSQFSQSIFNAGFNWKAVEALWPGFEEAFRGFGLVAWFDALVADTRIIRRGAKIQAVRDNAGFLSAVRAGAVADKAPDAPKGRGRRPGRFQHPDEVNGSVALGNQPGSGTHRMSKPGKTHP